MNPIHSRNDLTRLAASSIYLGALVGAEHVGTQNRTQKVPGTSGASSHLSSIGGECPLLAGDRHAKGLRAHPHGLFCLF